MERLKIAFGRYCNPMYVKLASMLVILAIVIARIPGPPDASGWP
jgi:hypothetical protein